MDQNNQAVAAPKPVQELDQVVIRFAGDSGDGMQLTGDQFTRTTALMGNDIATFPDFPAEIRAPAGTLPGVSAFQLRFSSFDIHTPGDAPDVLVAMNPAALKDYPATFVASTYAPNRDVMLELVRRFPSITVIDLQSVLEQVRSIMDRAALAIQYVFLFTLLHETVHRTAFETQWLNDAVARVCSLAIALPADWFRYFHFAHHRYTQDPRNDPELAFPKPETLRQYLIHISGIPLWWGHLKTLNANAMDRGQQSYVPAKGHHKVRVEARAAEVERLLGAGQRASSLTALFAGAASTLWVYSHYPYSEILQAATFTGFFVQAMRVRAAPTARHALWLGVWAGLLFNAKYVLALPILAVLLVALIFVHPQWTLEEGQFAWWMLILFGGLALAGPGSYRLDNLRPRAASPTEQAQP